MGVDYSPVGGIGIEVTKEIKSKLIKANDGNYDDMDSLLDDLDLPYKVAGNGSYTGNDNDYYVMVEGETLTEINSNTDRFIEVLGNLGVEIKLDDLKVIQELHVW